MVSDAHVPNRLSVVTTPWPGTPMPARARGNNNHTCEKKLGQTQAGGRGAPLVSDAFWSWVVTMNATGKGAGDGVLVGVVTTVPHTTRVHKRARNAPARRAGGIVPSQGLCSCKAVSR